MNEEVTVFRAHCPHCNAGVTKDEAAGMLGSYGGRKPGYKQKSAHIKKMNDARAKKQEERRLAKENE